MVQEEYNTVQAKTSSTYNSETQYSYLRFVPQEVQKKVPDRLTPAQHRQDYLCACASRARCHRKIEALSSRKQKQSVDIEQSQMGLAKFALDNCEGSVDQNAPGAGSHSQSDNALAASGVQISKTIITPMAALQ